MSQLVSARMPDATAERLRRYARKKQRSVNETFAMAVEEWLRQNEFAMIDFRDTSDGRQAFISGFRLPVWWIIKIARAHEMDPKRTSEYWDNRLSPERVQAALEYYDAFAAEIDALIEEFEHTHVRSLKRRYPDLDILEVGTNKA